MLIQCAKHHIVGQLILMALRCARTSPLGSLRSGAVRHARPLSRLGEGLLRPHAVIAPPHPHPSAPRPSRRSRQFPEHMNKPLGGGYVLTNLPIIKSADQAQYTLFPARRIIA